MTSDLAEIWSRIQGELRQAVPAETYDIWLEPLEPARFENGTLTLEAPPEVGRWVRDRFGRVLGACVSAVLGPEVEVDLTAPAERMLGARFAVEPADGDLNPKFTFDQFVIGDANRFAHAASLAVAELPGQAYNPLFVYGPPGVGKTHLLHSIGNYVRSHGAGLTVRYTTAERFTNEFITALQSGAVDHFKGRYRRNDILLIDDVQFLQSKAKTEEEFFHTFNALYDTGSQLVLTCDRLPSDLGALENRLRERFEAGLLTEIRSPDPQTRLTVLRKRVQHDGIVLDDERVLDTIAARVSASVRAIEGALIRVVAFAALTGQALTPELADEVLGSLRLADRAPAPVSVAQIQELVAETFGISMDELVSASREARLAWPRQVAMYLAREHTAETLPAIGARFGGRAHTTVLHACHRTTDRIASDAEAYETVRALTVQLQSSDTDRSD